MSSFPLFIKYWLNMEEIHFPMESKSYTWGVWEGGFYFFICLCASLLIQRLWASPEQEKQGRVLLGPDHWYLKQASQVIGLFLEWSRMYQKSTASLYGRKEEIFYLRNKKLICPSPQFVYKPLKTLQPTPHLSDTQTLIKQGQNQSRNKLRQGLPFLGLLPKRRVY